MADILLPSYPCLLPLSFIAFAVQILSTMTKVVFIYILKNLNRRKMRWKNYWRIRVSVRENLKGRVKKRWKTVGERNLGGEVVEVFRKVPPIVSRKKKGRLFWEITAISANVRKAQMA